MKIYHTETKADYDALMVELEAEGYEWIGGEIPPELSLFDKYGSESTVTTYNGIAKKFMQYSKAAFQIENYPNERIIEYKAKGENMAEEMKHKLQEVAFDISASIESFARGISEAESDLK